MYLPVQAPSCVGKVIVETVQTWSARSTRSIRTSVLLKQFFGFCDCNKPKINWIHVLADIQFWFRGAEESLYTLLIAIIILYSTAGMVTVSR